MSRELRKLCRRLVSLALPVPVRQIGHATRDESARPAAQLRGFTVFWG